MEHQTLHRNKTLHRDATLFDVQRWLDAGVLRSTEAVQAVRLLDLLPSVRSAWDFVRRRLTWIGALLLAAALIFFIASQWGDFGLGGRLALVLAVTAASTAAALWFGVDTAAGQALVLLAVLSFGPAVAVYGQAYQLEQTWLYGRWCLVAAAYAWAARSAVARVAALALGHVTLLLAWPFPPWAAADGYPEVGSWPLVAIVLVGSALLLFLWHRLGWRRESADLWTVRATYVFATAVAMVPALGVLADEIYRGPIGLALWVVALAAGAVLATYLAGHRGDPVLVTAGLLGAALLIGTAWIRWTFEEFQNEGALLLSGVVVCALSGAGTWWFRRWYAQHEDDPPAREEAAS